jgi:hypothetical protein
MLYDKYVGDLAYHSKNLKDVTSFILLDATTLNFDHEMVYLHFKYRSSAILLFGLLAI